jgi:quercetin 2,3-dioxygenase
MTAGKGIIHSETSSEAFMKEGGPVEILQLWVNLPARLKNAAPAYIGLQKEEIPTILLQNNTVGVDLVSNSWDDHRAPIQPLTDVLLATIKFSAGASLRIPVPAGKTVLFYMIRGALAMNGKEVTAHDLVVFGKEEGMIEINASTGSLLLFGHATPINEPVAAHGPFVMNTQEEIRQAFIEYQQGKMGIWQH